MAYFSLHAYDADVWIPSFSGLRQSEEMASDLRYAMEAENVETPRGVIQPMAAPVVLSYTTFESIKIETLACFHRRWYTGAGSKDWLVAAAGGKLFYKQDSASSWTQLAFPTGVTAWESNVWSWVTYEINPAGAAAPVDVLLLSNAKDGMIIIKPPYTATVSNPDWKVEKVDTRSDPTVAGTGPKFGVIERHAERIWGGAIPDDPDMLIYSRPYDPTNWTDAEQNWSTPGQNEEQPEDVAGSIQQPSWDGDSFSCLRAFGNQLVAIKNNRVWRVMGVDPGEYQFKEQYGGGTAYPNTVVVDNERILMVEKDGLSVYDGLSVSPFQRHMIERLWKAVNPAALDQMCAALFKNRYYVAYPTGSSTVNNELLVYNVEEGSFLHYTDIYIESMLVTEDHLYATSSTLPGKILDINYDSWEKGAACEKKAKWVTPWMDFGRKSIAKGGYEIYFSPEVRNGPVVFRFTIETEKKAKSKDVVVQNSTFNSKQKKIRLTGTSRKFRLIFETVTVPQGATWRLTGGIQMVVEIDPD